MDEATGRDGESVTNNDLSIGPDSCSMGDSQVGRDARDRSTNGVIDRSRQARRLAEGTS